MRKNSLAFDFNIILVGFMGCGKSTIAKDLSRLLNAPNVDIDNVTLKISGKKSIIQIFEEDGDSQFREFEKMALFQILKNTGQIIATGGGTLIYNPPIELKKLEILNPKDKIIYLNMSFELCKKRCSYSNRRPLFQNPKEAEILYNKRAPLYQKMADLELKIDDLNSKQISEHIATHLSLN